MTERGNGAIDHSGKSEIKVVVYDSVGPIYETLRDAPDDIRVESASETPSQLTPGDADVAVVAAYERTDWQTARRLQDEMPTVVVSARYDQRRAARALSFGLDGYLDAALPPTTLTRAIKGAFEGELAYPRAVLGRWIRWQRSSQPGGPSSPAQRQLTRRQVEVLAFVARGAADKEIAGMLGITTATAQKHVQNILERLGVPNRAAAAALLRSGMLDDEVKGHRM